MQKLQPKQQILHFVKTFISVFCFTQGRKMSCHSDQTPVRGGSHINPQLVTEI